MRNVNSLNIMRKQEFRFRVSSYRRNGTVQLKKIAKIYKNIRFYLRHIKTHRTSVCSANATIKEFYIEEAD